MGHDRLSTSAVVGVATLLLCVPALYNGFPLLYPDSIDYLRLGRPVAEALLGDGPPGYTGFRSAFYSLSLLPFHLERNAAPIVVWQAGIVAGVLWLTLRAFLARRAHGLYLGTVGGLATLTGAGWFSGFAMPDVLAAVAILCVALLGLAHDRLSPGERLATAALLAYAVVSHASHLLLLGGLVVCVTVLHAVARSPRERARVAIGWLLASAAAALISQLTLHAWLHGRPTLLAPGPPFLLARVIADGTGKRYLETHCDSIDWAICRFGDRLPNHQDTFLWDPEGIWQTAPASLRARLRAEEGAVVRAVVLAHPGDQLAASATNILEQLTRFGLGALRRHVYVEQQIDARLPRLAEAYRRSRQARDSLPVGWASRISMVAALAGLAAVIGFATLRPRRGPDPLRSLAVVVMLGLLGNAAILASLSGPADRYQARVIWLLPFLACLYAGGWSRTRP